MARCDVCGNEYARPMVIRHEEKMGTFDSFECAIQAMAPVCPHCECRVIGHGVETGGQIFCCASCARLSRSGAMRA
jgi:hypothetical protein